MNFFQQELRKIVGPRYPDATYIGRVCYVYLSARRRAKIQIVSWGKANVYVLNVILTGEDNSIEVHYPLSQEEKELMIPVMDAFSQKRYGQSLADCRAQYLEEVGAECQQEPQSVPEMQM